MYAVLPKGLLISEDLSALLFWRKAYTPAASNNNTRTEPPAAAPTMMPILDFDFSGSIEIAVR